MNRDPISAQAEKYKAQAEELQRRLNGYRRVLRENGIEDREGEREGLEKTEEVGKG